MWVILAGLVAVAMLTATIYEQKWDDESSSSKISTTMANNIAGNIIDYATIAKNAALGESTFNVLIPKNKIQTYASYELDAEADYRSAMITYGADNSSKYELVSWDSIYNKSTTAEQVMNALSNRVNTHSSIKGNTNYVPLLIINNNCTATLVDGYVGNIYKKQDGYKNLFKDICTNYRPSGFVVGKYNMLIQIME